MGINPEKMSRADLISYLTYVIDRWSAINLRDEGATLLLALQQRVYQELVNGSQPIYKVCNIDATHVPAGAVMEFQARYFYSLQAAKKELKHRYHSLLGSHLVASPEEMQILGVEYGIRPDLFKSVITNHDLRKRAPGRLKLYEVRMKAEHAIIPVQLVLSEIEITPIIQIKTDTKKKQGITLQFPHFE